MPFLGSIIPNNVVGVGKQERAQKREKQRKADETERNTSRPTDGAELSARAVDESEAVRSTKGNETEEGHEDRAEHALYRLSGNQPPQPRGLDLEG